MNLKGFLLLIVCLSYTKASFYTSVKNDGKLKIKETIHKTTTPSLISCSLKCRVMDTKSEAFWNLDECSCVKWAEKEEENGGEMTLTGTFLRMKEVRKMGNAQEEKEKKPSLPLSTTPTVPPSTKALIPTLPTGGPSVSSVPPSLSSTGVPSTSRIIATTTGNIEKKWRRITIQKEKIEVQKGALLGNIPKLTKEYILSFDFESKRFPNKRSILLTIKNENMEQIIEFINGMMTFTSSGVDSKEFQFNFMKYKRQWVNIKLSQLLNQNGNHELKVVIGNKTEFSKFNNQPQEFHDLKVYTSESGYSRQPGYLKEVWIDVLANTHTDTYV